jgi:protease-4
MVGLALMCTVFFLVSLLIIALLTGEAGIAEGGAKIGVITIEGVISSDLTEKTVRQLSAYADDASIKAIVLRIESPGGGVASSQEIYESVRRVRSGGKVVVASMGGVAASGGYYVACGAERIFANAGTLTGSIGVIVQLANAEELLRKVGVMPTVITSGAFKDSGNPTRSLRPEERQVFHRWSTISTNSSSRRSRRGEICPSMRSVRWRMGEFIPDGKPGTYALSMNSAA